MHQERADGLPLKEIQVGSGILLWWLLWLYSRGAAFGPDVKPRPISGVENTADISKLFVYTQVSLHTFSPGNQYTDMLKINLLYYRPTNNMALTSLSLFYSAYFPHNPIAISTIFTLNIN